MANNSDDSARGLAEDEELGDNSKLLKTASRDDTKTVVVVSATESEAPFGTQIFWLVVWMLKYVIDSYAILPPSPLTLLPHHAPQQCTGDDFEQGGVCKG
jgi:hypothetical protein